jgi:hypothetical protein
MEALDKKYLDQLDQISQAIQESEDLALYIEEEEEEQYNALREKFEPYIHEVYEYVAENDPLQIISLEKKLLDDAFEGLYLSRILGYAVLRGEVNDKVKYMRPQNHFKDILLAICNSNNFDVLKNRVGQAVQLGFALSSDIWITNIMNTLKNKRVIYFLESQKNEKFRDVRTRRTSRVKFAKQFESLNYYTAEFPQTVGRLKILAPSLKSFLFHRAENDMDNSSLMSHIKTFLETEAFYKEPEFIEIMLLVGLYYDLPTDIQESFKKALNKVRSAHSNFDETFFMLLEEMQESKHVISAENQKRFSALVDKTKKDELSKYFKTLDIINAKGYIDETAIDAARDYYYQHEGLSIQNTVLRNAIFANFRRVFGNLIPSEYTEYFELNKTIVNYINIFSNQKFNQDVKELSLVYIKKLLKFYTDKRGRDYQDIKKFVTATFTDLGFMNAKDLKELFKTKRKKKVAE